jgi:hypothetical protein
VNAVRDVARRLGGEAAGGQVLAPGPGHSPSDRSLCIKFADGRLIVHSFAGDPWRACMLHVRRRLGEPAPEPRHAPSRPVAKNDPAYHRRQHEKAGWLWRQRQPIEGTIAERYLRQARSLRGPLPATLGYLKAYKEHPPALIAAFGLAEESEPGVLAAPKAVGAVLLIALKPDGSGKAEVESPKKIIGSPKGQPIAVSPINDLGGLGITEGLEDALSVYEATGLGAWAAGGATFMSKLAAAIPRYVEAVTIYAHADAAGQAGAEALYRNCEALGLDVSITGGAADGQ